MLWLRVDVVIACQLLSRRLRIPSRSGSHVGSNELVPVGSSYVLVRVGRSVLSLQGRELGGIFDKGELWH
jgi:hypothetical protein